MELVFCLVIGFKFFRFIDSFDQSRVQDALNHLAKNLEKIQCVPLESRILNKTSPQAILKGVDFLICPKN
jgi:hypothetical protein